MGAWLTRTQSASRFNRIMAIVVWAVAALVAGIGALGL